MLRRTLRRIRSWVKKPEAKSLILMYHRIDDTVADPWGLCVSPALFEEQMDVLAKRGLGCPLSAVQHRPGKVAVTFDDGYADNLYNAKPVLERRKLNATVFVVSGASGTSGFWWDELEQILLHSSVLPADPIALTIEGKPHLYQVDANDLELHSPARFRDWIAWRDAPPTSRHFIFHALWEALRSLQDQDRARHLAALREWSGTPATTTHFRPMVLDELRQLTVGDTIEIGSHTVTHSRLSGLTADQQYQEVSDSKARLTEVTGKVVDSFSFPFGGSTDFNATTLHHLRKAGYARACTTLGHAVTSRCDPWKLPRLHVPNLPARHFEDWLDHHLKN